MLSGHLIYSSHEHCLAPVQQPNERLNVVVEYRPENNHGSRRYERSTKGKSSPERRYIHDPLDMCGEVIFKVICVLAAAERRTSYRLRFSAFRSRSRRAPS